MERKHIIVIVVLSIITVGTILAFIPVFMYGFSVDVLSVNMGVGIDMGSMIEPSGDSYDPMQLYVVPPPTVNVEHVEVGPYKYLFDGGKAVSEGTNMFQLLTQYINITIYINITTPNDQSYEMTFTLEDLVNMLTQQVDILLGPDEIEIVSGTYIVSVAIEISISIPDIPIYDSETFEFGPFNINVVVD